MQLAARGTIAAPELNGFVALADVTAVSDEPNIAAEHVNARIDLRGRQVTLTQLTADVNGGTFEAGGSATLGRGGLEAIDLQATTRDFAFDAPLDLRSLSDATLTVLSNGDEIVVGGQVTIDEAGLTGDFNFDQGLLAAMTARPELNLTRERNALLERVRFDVNVDTSTPVIVDNNVAQAEVSVDLRLVGSPYRAWADRTRRATRRRRDHVERAAIRSRTSGHHVCRRTAHPAVSRSASEYVRWQL